MNATLIENKEKLISICQNNDIAFMGIFGSFTTGDFRDDSDVDFLVDFSKPKSLLEIVRIERLLSESLGRKADLLTEASLSPYLKDRIKKETQVFYDEKG